MNGITEPLPGLLDDPQFQITDLPTLTEFHIAPLRNPAPPRHANVPSPLEPVTGNVINGIGTTRNNAQANGISEKRRTPKITPNDVLLAREAKKPHLAISELLEDNEGSDSIPTQLPSFVSLSVVEKSPTQTPSLLGQSSTQKRPRLDQDVEYLTHDPNRHLPRPAQKNGRQSRPTPLLPAIVTGLHEPPPSAALLPSMEVGTRQGLVRTVPSKIQVKDILMNLDSQTPSLSTGLILSPVPNETFTTKELSDLHFNTPTEPAAVPTTYTISGTPTKDNKARRARRKWTDKETKDLLTGVKKYGVGKWKQILDDPDFSFTERSSVDLKDRYRVCAKDEIVHSVLSLSSPSIGPSTQSTSVMTDSSSVNSPQPHQTDPTSPSAAPQYHKQRRKRRAWTVDEDDALIRGVTKHGFQWTVIHDDPELDLSHRRATDLRDRIRNRFPEGYKQAESAPLRSELRKAERSNGVMGLGSGSMKLHRQATNSSDVSKTALSSGSGTAGSAIGGTTHTNSTHAGYTAKALPKLSDMMNLDNEKEKEKEKEKESAGVTLPSFTLDDEEMDWDNRLPPVLLPWDEVGM